MGNKNKQCTHSTALNSENALPEDTFWPNSIHTKTFLKHYNQQKKKNVRFGKWRNIIFHVTTFWPNNDHFDFALKIFTDDCFVIRINKIIYSSSGVPRAFLGGRGRNEEENEEKLRNNERSYRKMRKDWGNHQGGSQPHSPGWARVPLSSFFLKSRLSFLIFPQTVTHFLPHFGPPGGRVAHNTFFSVLVHLRILLVIVLWYG